MGLGLLGLGRERLLALLPLVVAAVAATTRKFEKTEIIEINGIPLGISDTERTPQVDPSSAEQLAVAAPLIAEDWPEDASAVPLQGRSTLVYVSAVLFKAPLGLT